MLFSCSQLQIGSSASSAPICGGETGCGLRFSNRLGPKSFRDTLMTLAKYAFAELLGIKVCCLKLPQVILGHLLAIEKMKFSSFHQAGAKSDGPQLLLWGQVQLCRLPKQLTTIYHKDSGSTLRIWQESSAQVG